MKVLLDTNFIITALKQKIDLLEQIKNLIDNPEIIIPLEVINEIKKLQSSKETKTTEKQAAQLAILIIQKNPSEIKTPSIKTPDVDAGMIAFTIKNKVTIATLDRNLKQKIKNKAPQTQFLTIRQKTQIKFS